MSDARAGASMNPSSSSGYDELPYPSMPFAYTQPGHLAALATLYGLNAPDAERATVLELGCASGGNIIPLAARYPKARFTGMDLSQRHINEGRSRAAALGLQNIDLRQEDLTHVKFAGGTFDYIICHGVFSWVSRAAQDAIFRICRETLAPAGVAIVSYNVLPGAYLRNIARDICRHHVGSTEPLRERVANARRALADIAQLSSEKEPYGVFLRNEVNRLEQLPAAYVYGEFLSPDNVPMHFREFTERARRHELNFLCEADLGSSVGEMLYPATAQRIKQLAGCERLAEEQYKDFISGRPFRRSVLVRASNGLRAASLPIPDRLYPLHLVSRLTQEASGDADHFLFRDPRGRAVTTKDSAVRGALARLADAYPSSVKTEELIKSDPESALARNSDTRDRVCKALFALVTAHQATASTLPTRAGQADANKPKVWPLARLEAAARQPWLTSLGHAPIPARNIDRDLIAHLNGNLERPALRAHVVQLLREGRLSRSDASPDQADNSAPLGTVAERYLERALGQLALSALLEP